MSSWAGSGRGRDGPGGVGPCGFGRGQSRLGPGLGKWAGPKGRGRGGPGRAGGVASQAGRVLGGPRGGDLLSFSGPRGGAGARQGGVSPRAACSGAEPHLEDQGRGRRSEVEAGAVSAMVRPRGGAGPDPGLGLCKLRGAKVGAGWGGSVGGASHSRARVPMSWQLGAGPPVTWPRLDGARVGLGARERRAGDHRSQPCARACTHSSCTV